MSNAIVSNVYRYVIDDVINQVRGDFEDMGIDDSILQELQRSWESKVARSRVANFGFKDANGYYEEDGDNPDNNNNNGANTGNPIEYQHLATAASLASLATAASRNNQQQQQQQQGQQQHGYNLPPPRMIPDPSTLVNQYQMMQPQNNHILNNNNNNDKPNLPELQLPGLSRPNIPQNDGGNDDSQLTTEEIDQRIEDMIQSSQVEDETPGISFTASTFKGEPLALDSLPEHVQKLMKDARERAIKAGALKSRTRISQLDGEGDDEPATENNEDEINSELDDTDEDDEDGEGGEEIEHIILCLYDKVTRTKNKWKCILKDGIMLVNGRDYLFHRANGDFEW